MTANTCRQCPVPVRQTQAYTKGAAGRIKNAVDDRNRGWIAPSQNFGNDLRGHTHAQFAIGLDRKHHLNPQRVDMCNFKDGFPSGSRLGKVARKLISDADHEVFLSDVSVLEIATKWSAGKLGLPSPPRDWIETQVATWQLRSLAIETEHIFRSSELPTVHRDPFDRLLVAQSLHERSTLLTPDPAILRYPVATAW